MTKIRCKPPPPLPRPRLEVVTLAQLRNNICQSKYHVCKSLQTISTLSLSSVSEPNIAYVAYVRHVLLSFQWYYSAKKIRPKCNKPVVALLLYPSGFLEPNTDLANSMA